MQDSFESTSEENVQSSEIDSSSQNIDTPQVSSGPERVVIEDPERYHYKDRPIREWESGYMRQQDYTQKTTQIAEERKFYNNLSHDLEKVKQNPERASEFMRIYPQKFHGYLKYVIQESQSSPTQTQPNHQQHRFDPVFEQRIAALENEINSSRVKAISAELDRTFEKLSTKYPYADQEAVIARAQSFISKMKEMNPGIDPNEIRISEKQWDDLWKSQHDRAYKLYDTQYKKQVQSQLEAHKKLSDPSGPGGSPVGQAPREFKTIREAGIAMRKAMQAGEV